MAITVTAGQRVTAAVLNNFAPKYVQKVADQSVTNSTTFVNDSELFLTLDANRTYVVEAVIGARCSSNATPPGIKLDWVVTGTLTLNSSGRFISGPNGPATPVAVNNLDTNTKLQQRTGFTSSVGFSMDTSGDETLIVERLTVAAGASGGVLTLRFAQQAAGGAGVTTTIAAGAYLMARAVD